jgi:hypothetical protein
MKWFKQVRNANVTRAAALATGLALQFTGAASGDTLYLTALPSPQDQFGHFDHVANNLKIRVEIRLDGKIASVQEIASACNEDYELATSDIARDLIEKSDKLEAQELQLTVRSQIKSHFQYFRDTGIEDRTYTSLPRLKNFEELKKMFDMIIRVYAFDHITEVANTQNPTFFRRLNCLSAEPLKFP